jgi:uracil-DNA glycosylase family protein
MLDTIMPNNKVRFFFASIILTPPPALVKQRGTRTYLGLFVCDSHVRARLQPQRRNLTAPGFSHPPSIHTAYTNSPIPSLPPNALRFHMAKRAAAQPALPLFPPNATVKQLREEAAHCKACDLWKNATQTVFGEGGGTKPKVIFVGEQPGDQEDIEGKPFVGPAGKLLDSALIEAGIDRKKVYVTNAVKHFKWEPRGKRRIHKKPNAIEIAACRLWLDAEIAAIRPNVIVCLGATAAQSLLGRDFRVTMHHGEFLKSDLAPHVMATVHPSSILRAPDDATRHEEMKRFIADLKKVAHHV